MDEDRRPVEKGIENWRPVNALLGKLNQIERVAKLSIEKFTRDVFYYLEYGYIRKFVDDIVDDGIPRDESCVLVSHSL